MRLISCYIESFGGLSECRFDFAPGLNVICRENGFGKSTLAAFLKVMLYGFFDNKKQSLAENDKKHYMPYSGKGAGGHLVLEADGEILRIERFFAPKGKGDRLAVYKQDGTLTDRLGDCPGRTLFGIDADGFLRTLLHSERVMEEENTNETISDRLSEMVGSGGDMGGAQIALDVLEKQRKFYFRQGGSGEIGVLTQKLARTQNEVASLTSLLQKESELQGELEHKRKQIEGLSEKEREQRERHTALVALTDDRGREQLKREREEKSQHLRAEIEKARAVFGEHRPSPEALRDTEAKALRLEAIVAAREGSREERLREVRRFFRANTSEDEIARMHDLLHRTEQDTPPEVQYTERERELSAYTQEDADALRSLACYKKPIYPWILLLLSAIVSAALILLAPEIAIFSLGAWSIAIYYVLHEVRKMRTIHAKAFEILHNMGIKKEKKGATLALADEIEATEEKRTVYEKKLSEYKAQRERQIHEIDRYIASVTNATFYDRRAALYEISRQFANYSLLMNQKLQKFDDNETYRVLSQEVEEFLSKYSNLGDRPFDTLRKALYMLERAEGELMALEQQPLPPACRKEDLEERRACEQELSEIRAQSEHLLRETARIENELLRMESERHRLDELEAECQELTERREAYEKRLRIIRLTKEYIEKGRDRMTSKYLSGTKEHFESILTTLGEDASLFSITPTFEISKEEAGAYRKSETFSRGERDLFALSARFALIRVLYPSTPPFVILDDPFAALDDKHLALAMKLLQSLAKDTQILYLTCSEARARV